MAKRAWVGDEEQDRCPAESGEDVFAKLISPMDADQFFAETWQRKPRLFPAKDATVQRPLVTLTWADACDLLLLAAGAPGVPLPDGCDLLCFKDQELTHQYDDTGPCAALIDGGSCVVNHAELVFPAFANTCLQLRSMLLHVYINTYITPAQSQAVSAHADDRDVIILQLRGSKRWKVYEEPPIPFPYSDEQVGKNNIQVPTRILEKTLIEYELQPGDVLYMPRGYVHEASCSSNASWHATLAIATHDWSWTKAFMHMVGNAMDNEATSHWRRAVPLSLGGEGDAKSEDFSNAEAELAEIASFLQKNLTVRNLREAMANKLRPHNRNQYGGIMTFQKMLNDRACDASNSNKIYWRLRSVRYDSFVRKATKEEKDAEAMASPGRGRGRGRTRRGAERGRGLVVRDEIANAVIVALANLEEKGTAGLPVSELGATCTDAEASALFDELTKICLARLCVCNGAFKMITPEIASV